MIEIFNQYAPFIIFIHVLSAIVWVGGMIAIRLTVHPSLQTIESPQIKLGKTLEIMKRLLNMVIPMIIALIITAVLLAIGEGLKETELYPIVLVKEGIWTVMTIIFTVIYIKRYQAEKLFNQRDFEKAKERVKLIPNLLLPINISLGLVALYLGIVLRGF